MDSGQAVWLGVDVWVSCRSDVEFRVHHVGACNNPGSP